MVPREPEGPPRGGHAPLLRLGQPGHHARRDGGLPDRPGDAREDLVARQRLSRRAELQGVVPRPRLRRRLGLPSRLLEDGGRAPQHRDQVLPDHRARASTSAARRTTSPTGPTRRARRRRGSSSSSAARRRTTSSASTAGASRASSRPTTPSSSATGGKRARPSSSRSSGSSSGTSRSSAPSPRPSTSPRTRTTSG